MLKYSWNTQWSTNCNKPSLSCILTQRKWYLPFMTITCLSLVFWLLFIEMYRVKVSIDIRHRYQTGANISEKELIYKVNKQHFHLKPPSKVQLNHPYFIPKSQVLQTYNDAVLREPKSGCEDSHAVHIIVPSPPQDLKMRIAIRETWGSVVRGFEWPRKVLSLSLRLTFVLGVSDKVNNSLQIQETDGSSDGPTDVNNSSNSKNQAARTPERGDAEWDDILQFDMIDSYENLTRKILLAMRWVNSSCKDVLYIVKVDQDVFINIPLLLSFLKHYGKENSIYGHIYNGGNAERNGKWATSKSAYPLKRYPVYASGTAYIISRSAAETVLKLCPHFPYVPVEDAFITGILASVGSVDRINVSGFTHWIESKPKPCLFINDERYFGNGMTAFDLRKIWEMHSNRAEC